MKIKPDKKVPVAFLDTLRSYSYDVDTVVDESLKAVAGKPDPQARHQPRLIGLWSVSGV